MLKQVQIAVDKKRSEIIENLNIGINETFKDLEKHLDASIDSNLKKLDLSRRFNDISEIIGNKSNDQISELSKIRDSIDESKSEIKSHSDSVVAQLAQRLEGSFCSSLKDIAIDIKLTELMANIKNNSEAQISEESKTRESIKHSFSEIKLSIEILLKDNKAILSNEIREILVDTKTDIKAILTESSKKLNADITETVTSSVKQAIDSSKTIQEISESLEEAHKTLNYIKLPFYKKIFNKGE